MLLFGGLMVWYCEAGIEDSPYQGQGLAGVVKCIWVSCMSFVSATVRIPLRILQNIKSRRLFVLCGRELNHPNQQTLAWLTAPVRAGSAARTGDRFSNLPYRAGLLPRPAVTPLSCRARLLPGPAATGPIGRGCCRARQ